MPYQQLSEQERQVICALDWAGWTRAAIARRLGRHRATAPPSAGSWTATAGRCGAR